MSPAHLICHAVLAIFCMIITFLLIILSNFLSLVEKMTIAAK